MRNRFRPNLSRRSGPSTRVSSPSSSTSPSVSEPVVPQTEDEPAVFIPPNSSRAEVSTESIELDLSSIENVEVNSIAQEASSSTPKTTTAEATSRTRRSRIKPSVTPRTRKKPANEGSKTTSQETNEVPSVTTEGSGGTGEKVISTAPTSTTVDITPSRSRSTITNDTEKQPKPSSQTSTPQSNSQPKTPNEVPKQAVGSAEGNPASSGSLLSRRKRATPNIGAAARRRASVSVPKEGVSDKGTSQSESSVSQQAEEIHDKNISENNETEERSSKRSKTTPEVLNNTIGVIEVTVQADTTQSAQPVEEEIPEEEEEEEEEQSYRKVEEKKRKTTRHSRPKEPLDPSKMTLQDLIYFNPKGNPMKSSVNAKRRRIEDKRKSSQSIESENGDGSTMEVDGQDSTDQPNTTTEGQSSEHSLETDTPKQGEDEGRLCAPQVKIGADGCIILDEESLLIKSPPNSTLEKSDIVYEDSNNLNYAAYFKQTKRTKWSMQETLKFYKALSQVGTDFSLMLPLFPKRKRRELKAKFKREDKFHRDLVDRALVHHTPITIEMFARPEQTEEEVLNDITSGTGNDKDSSTRK